MSIPAPNLAGALIGFNLGVELGQLTAVIPAFLLLALIERWRGAMGLRRFVSMAAMGAGLFWFVQRALLS
jgi:hypothetical protein